MGIGSILLSLQHFLHTPNSLELPLNHTPCHPHMHAHIHTGPRGCFVHCWNVHVECCLQLHPICTMCTMPIHEVPTYAHWPSSHPSMVGAPLCAHHTPPINLQQYSTLHLHLCTRSEPSCTATFGCAHPTSLISRLGDQIRIQKCACKGAI